MLLKEICKKAIARLTEFFRVRDKIEKGVAWVGESLGYWDRLIEGGMRKGFRTIIMMYHRVCPMQDWLFATCYGFSVSPNSFEKQVEYLTRNYDVISLSHLLEILQRSNIPPAKSVCFTFDDGYEDNYTYAYPILKRYGVPATFFLTTEYIGSQISPFSLLRSLQYTQIKKLKLSEIGEFKLHSPKERWQAFCTIWEELKGMPEERAREIIEEINSLSGVDILFSEGPMLSWEEIREMSENGMEFGAHTRRHPNLVSQPTLEEARWEIEQSKRDIEGKLGKEVKAFAYPYGKFDERIMEIVKEAGFMGAVTMLPQWVKGGENPYLLGRISPSDDFAIFKAKIAGFF
jgi:peptidoglycan/xylan/chitin deacetylase (PgdA/CDA1 family)